MDRSALAGIGVGAGVAWGPVVRMPEPVLIPDEGAAPAPSGDPQAERGRALAALEAVAADLEERGRAAGGESKGILDAEAMMARDPELAAKVEERTLAGSSAEDAIGASIAGYQKVLAGAGDYMAARVADLDAIRDRALARLRGVQLPVVPDPGHPFVLVARDLAPAETATLDPDKVIALVTEAGGPTSHTAILAKALGVPAVVACAGAAALTDGVRVIVDASAGSVVANPTDAEVAEVKRRQAAREAAAAAPAGPGATSDGHRVKLLANIGGPGELKAVAAAGAEGVGLLRTEFLFLDRDQPPTVAEQREAYAKVLEGVTGQVVVRTLDAGADKPLPFLGLGEEANPALGVRGLRVARARPEVLTDQLEAIALAAADTRAEVWVMAPMVATVEETRWFCEQARRGPVEHVGVMIEVPAAALAAEQLLGVADFASIGTNDLAQYTFGADRLQAEVAALQDPWQPALLKLIAMSADAGRRAGRPVGVCGEAAADPLLAAVLTGLGVTSLSMAPGSLPGVRALLARVTLADCRRLAERALAAPDTTTARAETRAGIPGLEELGL